MQGIYILIECLRWVPKGQKSNIWCAPITCQAWARHWGYSCEPYIITFTLHNNPERWVLCLSLFNRQGNQDSARLSCLHAQVQDTEIHLSHSKPQIHSATLWKAFLHWLNKYLSASVPGTVHLSLEMTHNISPFEYLSDFTNCKQNPCLFPPWPLCGVSMVKRC